MVASLGGQFRKGIAISASRNLWVTLTLKAGLTREVTHLIVKTTQGVSGSGAVMF